MAWIDSRQRSTRLVEGQTVAATFLTTVAATTRDAVALRWQNDDDGWESGPSASTPTRSPGRPPASGRSASSPGDRVVLMMRNRPEFHVLDMAALVLRGHAGLDLQLVVARADRSTWSSHCEAEGRPSSRTPASSNGS